MADLSTNVAAGDAGHAALHNQERAAINARTTLTGRKRPQEFTGLDASAADNTAALNTALAAMQPYDTWAFPAGSFKHTGKINWPAANPNVRVETTKFTELVATNPDQAAFTVAANGATLVGLKHTVLGATSRGGGQNQDTCPFFFTGISDLNVEGITSVGARDAAVFVFGVSRMTARGVMTRDSFADAFHITYGSTDLDLEGFVLDNPGDDGLAVVSYANEATCSRIKARNMHVLNSDARAYSIVGADSVDYHDITATRCRAAGLYIATEVGAGASNNSKSVTNVDVSHVNLTDVSWGFDQGAVCLLNLLSGSLMSKVKVRGVRANGMRGNSDQSAYSTIKNGNGSGGRFTGIVLSDWWMAKGTGSSPALYADGTNSSNVTKGSFPYTQLAAQSSGGTFVQNDEGTTLYNAAGNLGTSTSTASAPDITVQRVSAR